MSGEGAPSLAVEGAGLHVAVVAASWHTTVMNGLVSGALQTLERVGATYEFFTVPGSFELPVVAQSCARSGKFAAVVALGVVIRGGTPHFEYVCSAVTDGLTRVALDSELPVGFGVLTCDTEQQALDRAGLAGSRESKGEEAVLAALATAQVLRQVP